MRLARRYDWVMAAVLGVAVVGCDGGETPDPEGRMPSPQLTASSYAPQPLPADCAVVLSRIPPSVVRDVVNLANAVPEKEQLLCRARGTSPDGGFQLQLQLTMQVMPADQLDPTGAELPQWQQATVRGLLDGDCGDSPQPSATEPPPFTLRCVSAYSDPAVGVHLAAAGEDGRVAGVDATAYYRAKSDKEAAQRFADSVADAAAQAALTI